MDAGGPPRARSGIALLAGLQAGIGAVLVMLGWLSFASLWYHRSIWSVANLLGSAVYGESALRPGFGRGSLFGLAVYLGLYSALGALFAAAVSGRLLRLRPALLGILWGVGCYYLLFGFVWERLDPLIPLYTHDGPMLVGHVLYGALLGRFPRYLQALASPPEPAALPAGEASSAGPQNISEYPELP